MHPSPWLHELDLTHSSRGRQDWLAHLHWSRSVFAVDNIGFKPSVVIFKVLKYSLALSSKLKVLSQGVLFSAFCPSSPTVLQLPTLILGL